MAVDKDTSPLVKGFNYPSAQVTRCPRYHRCIVSNKCQSYDAHQPDCQTCETLVRAVAGAPIKLGGFLPEGKYMPDLQDAVHTIEQLQRRAFAHRDAEGQQIESRHETMSKFDRLHKSIEMSNMFMRTGIWQLDEQVTQAWYDPAKRQFLGRIE